MCIKGIGFLAGDPQPGRLQRHVHPTHQEGSLNLHISTHLEFQIWPCPIPPILPRQLASLSLLIIRPSPKDVAAARPSRFPSFPFLTAVDVVARDGSSCREHCASRHAHSPTHRVGCRRPAESNVDEARCAPSARVLAQCGLSDERLVPAATEIGAACLC